MPDEGSEKTEQATPRRREEAREEGQVARSLEVNSLLIFAAALLSINAFALPLMRHYEELLKYALSNCGIIKVTSANLLNITTIYTLKALTILAPIFIAIVIAAIISNILQVGFLVSTKPLVPDFGRFDPMKGFRNLFSKYKLVDLVKGIIKIIIVSYTAYKTVANRIDKFPLIMDESVIEILIFIASMMYKVMLNVILVYIVIAVLDYGLQRWQFEEGLKMTKQEIKEEFKQQEGDPLIKGRIRSIQREMARRRMMKEVEKAEVVVTNPTHLAVALRYDMEKMDAPMVVAKGARLIALKIREIAAQHDIPIVEDKLLAQSLYKKVEIGEFVPMELYKAVAEILAYVYKVSKKFKEKYSRV